MMILDHFGWNERVLCRSHALRCLPFSLVGIASDAGTEMLALIDTTIFSDDVLSVNETICQIVG